MMEKKEEEKRLQKRKKKVQLYVMMIQNMSPEELHEMGIEDPAQLQAMIETGQLKDVIEKV